eukprot:gene7537-574_t
MASHNLLLQGHDCRNYCSSDNNNDKHTTYNPVTGPSPPSITTPHGVSALEQHQLNYRTTPATTSESNCTRPTALPPVRVTALDLQHYHHTTTSESNCTRPTALLPGVRVTAFELQHYQPPPHVSLRILVLSNNPPVARLHHH